MASVAGKWKIDSSDNFEEYMKAIGVPDDKREIALKFLSAGSGMTQEFKVDGDNWTLTTVTAAGEKSFSFTIGKEENSMTLDGRNMKVTFTIDGDSLVEKQKGDTFECTHVRKSDGNTLTMTLTGGGQTCVRKFVKV
ncbi:sodium/calcium exchanger regulatory protein 1-like [Ruditapes philippinarum]|uniref:sodium/calcium exchanger regulatory protein 1-like n=1 Tax=Ruditapes philippinarum TaxID=129788 RepID=UPI00295BEB18|nr:sodium/calcium exchanger regulatory protein 1-like [Ruditapes philippinarum]